MALLHRATLTPTKGELVAAWLPTQDWYDGVVPPAPRPVGAFRIDDPDGAVGIELMLIETEPDGPLWHVPMTYRAAPLDGLEQHLIGLTEHSVLGTRYVYDAAGDPVFQAVVRSTISGMGHQAELVRDLGDGTTEAVADVVTASGTGGDGSTVVIERRPVAAADADRADGSGVLIAQLVDGGEPLVVARLT